VLWCKDCYRACRHLIKKWKLGGMYWKIGCWHGRDTAILDRVTQTAPMAMGKIVAMNLQTVRAGV
jgi:hypothetical protein